MSDCLTPVPSPKERGVDSFDYEKRSARERMPHGKRRRMELPLLWRGRGVRPRGVGVRLLRAAFIFFFLGINFTVAFSQELRLVVSDRPLNEVLKSLPVEISFDDKALSEYAVSVKETFDSPEKALDFLLRGSPFTYERIQEVYVISVPKKKKRGLKTDVYRAADSYVFSGIIADKESGERLPFAYLTTNKGSVLSDEMGVFSMKRSSDLPVRVQVRYIGYEISDTLLVPGTHRLLLVPQTFEMKEVVVYSSPSLLLMHAGEASGETRINHRVARYLPGSFDNSVFTLLRMMPGVRASGEPSDDLIVRGGNTGESQIVFDGFTLFGLKNFNDQISSVNPYLVKDIRLMKGGMDASRGNRIGAVAEITGNEGSVGAVTAKANVSNYTANVFVSSPVGRRSALTAAYRQTFYNLYGRENVDGGSEDNSLLTTDVFIKPEYDFKDLNLKYSGKVSENDSYYVSLYGADDRFDFSVFRKDEFEVKAAEKNRQLGGAASYNRVWGKGGNTKLLASFSRLTSGIDNLTQIGQSSGVPSVITRTDNSIQEVSLCLRHHASVGERHRVQFGGEWQHYTGGLNGVREGLSKPAVFFTDDLSIGRFSMDAGLRADFPTGGKGYVQPRLSAAYRISDGVSATASWGLYNQFISRIPYQYDSGSYQLAWQLSDSTFTEAAHTLAGVAYSKNGFLVSLEGYFKQTRNGFYYTENGISVLDNTLTGVDLYAKKEWNRHAVFGSYSVVNSAKPKRETGQEVKAGGVGFLRPFYFSFNYVYGTGFSHFSTGGHEHGAGHGTRGQNHKGSHNNHSDDSNETYSRLDVGATCKWQFRNRRLQAGVSVLNVFGTENIKYNYRLTDQDRITNIYTKATPFTPMVFFEVVF